MLEYLDFIRKRHRDHDWVDNINTRYICTFAFAVGFLLFASEYGVKTMQCWEKPSWKPSWKSYADSFCFIDGSYFVDTTNFTLPHPKNLPDSSRRLSFYQVNFQN